MLTTCRPLAEGERVLDAWRAEPSASGLAEDRTSSAQHVLTVVVDDSSACGQRQSVYHQSLMLLSTMRHANCALYSCSTRRPTLRVWIRDGWQASKSLEGIYQKKEFCYRQDVRSSSGTTVVIGKIVAPKPSSHTIHLDCGYTHSLGRRFCGVTSTM
jgi:hypothetical protein